MSEELIEVARVGGTVVVHLLRVSPLNAATRGRLQERLSQLAQESPDCRLWLDFTRIEHGDDQAFALLVQLMQRLAAAGRRLLVANPCSLMREALAKTRLDCVLDLRAGVPGVLPSPVTAADDGFLRAVLDDSEDDDVRLIYADWLEDRDDPRGEFIRVQIERASLSADSSRRGELLRRERSLLDQHESAWAAQVASRVAQYEFRRGFIDLVTLSAAAFLENAADLARLAPIRELHLRPGWPRGTDFLAGLLAWPRLPSLRFLGLAYCGLVDARARQLAECPALASLRTLDLRCNGVCEAGALALAQSAHLGNLQSLDLSGNGTIGTEGRRALQARFGNGVSF